MADDRELAREIGQDVMLAVLAYIAKQEKVRISERTKAGLERVRAQGTVLGRPRSLSRPEIEQAREMYHGKKMTWAAIGRHFGVTAPTVRDLVSSLALT